MDQDRPKESTHLRSSIVVPPQRTDLVLSSDVPDIELYVLVRHGLDVEADCGDCGHGLVELEFVEDGWG